jgi:hypothetical protein
MRARLGVDGSLYLRQHFYELNGRVFQPYGEGREMYFAYARSISKWEQTQSQYDELEKAFVIKECGMGKDPQVVLMPTLEKEMLKPVETPKWLTMHYLERDPSRGVMVGYYKNDEHLKWIMGYNDKGSLVYNVRLKLKGEEEREGAHTAGFYGKQNVQFVILYTDGVENTGEYRVFHVKDTASKVTEERMRETWYPSEVKGSYFFYRFDEEVNIGKLRIGELIEQLKQEHFKKYNSYVNDEPLFATAEEVLEYRDGF